MYQSTTDDTKVFWYYQRQRGWLRPWNPFRIARFLDVGFDGSRPSMLAAPVSRRLLSFNIHAQTHDETITFLSRQTLFSRRFSLCDAAQHLCISLKTNWRKRVRVERTDDIRDAVRRF